MQITKNRQSESTILKMAKEAFPDKQVTHIEELTEGMCNVAYRISFSDGKASILKIAPADKTGLMTNEVNLMKAEVLAMELAREYHVATVAKVQYYDSSKRLCSSHYFFMEALEGKSFASVKSEMIEEEIEYINFETGQITERLTGIENGRFGMLGDEEHSFEKLGDFFCYLMGNVLLDAERKNIEIGVLSQEIMDRLLRERGMFDAVTKPVLVHWDMWDGNIFVKDGHISGIIDWERAMWGEAFMDDRFRRHTRNDAFLKGFGKVELSEAEMRRIYWYDIFLYLTMMTEGTYRGYEDDGQYKWAKTMFEASWKALVE